MKTTPLASALRRPYSTATTYPRSYSLALSKFPRYQLTFGPSPIHPLKRLSAHLGSKCEIWAKREDCNSGLAFGGNKTRKLEYLVPEAIAGKYTHLISVGGIQSNQTRQVAAVAAHLGLKCVLVQEDWVNYDRSNEIVYDKAGNIQLSRILGADVRLDSSGFDIGIRPSWEDAMKSVEAEGGKPFPIPAGCSMHPLGALGFVRFAEEVREQEKELGWQFDYIVVCAVTGSTMAGMVVGFAADGRERRVLGIDASAKVNATHKQVTEIMQNTSKLVELGKQLTAEDVLTDARFGGPEYGLPNDGTLDAIRTCARLEGMLTDPVYEGKSLHGMMELVSQGDIPEGSRVLYAHLGGVPALSAYSHMFRAG
ncbi:1-aminocyclopropane-1-carboxylate deaminase [Aulographum hederae CBS 113979]|uniref:1-aminocyclopropane-1-carboxylate deaminase n=1 Tax=Aulographum hederae CBS 113979 TaxID=1176131 RepID=A0A6G1GWB7_9PEZI|nr:1-aminocyclopropane-1-carboxylate deaminase [Aulographum hederae CBS 113979]